MASTNLMQMPSLEHINCRHVEHECNKCQGRAITLEHHSACSLKEKEEEGTQAEEEKSADREYTDRLGDVVQRYEPLPTEEELSATAIKQKAVEQAWEKYQQHRGLHWTACNDYYCSAHGSALQMKNRYPRYNICSICEERDHSGIHCKLAADVLAKEKEYRKQQRDNWKRLGPL
ncbi:hypothetical protein L211DRAFT_845794 [Terfezia boudieri ATCC MYA-4762]|uniref:Uncharacterized protein n=1 Tax=Terfezia boudieri ATCC MYA-4762 TaxID=1051890 RepID=A0A3N4MFQ4_9PEZI|nr:hypothetical protein L211DRAFT_845794 [Terfezia boudieri ATCC MYA-4762]